MNMYKGSEKGSGQGFRNGLVEKEKLPFQLNGLIPTESWKSKLPKNSLALIRIYTSKLTVDRKPINGPYSPYEHF